MVRKFVFFFFLYVLYFFFVVMVLLWGMWGIDGWKIDMCDFVIVGIVDFFRCLFCLLLFLLFLVFFLLFLMVGLVEFFILDICLFIVVLVKFDDGLFFWFWRFFEGLLNFLVLGVKFFWFLLDWWLMFVKLVLIVLKFLEFIVVNFEDVGLGKGVVFVIGVLWFFLSLILLIEVCRILEVCWVGEFVFVLSGVLMFDFFIGVFVGFGVRGLLYLVFSCWWMLGFVMCKYFLYG